MSVDPVAMDGDTAIIGVSPAIRRAVATARRFAPTLIPILLTGETGTGKELFAQKIHQWSGRHGSLVDVNCGALPRELVEGELFGHRRGSFTGAASDTGGLIANADGGTLFLDELSTLPLDGQVKLLRALETREVRRVGDTQKRRIDFRVISAVQQGFAQEVEQGRFRSDLFQRLAGVIIHLPPLSERMEDIEPLTIHFLSQRERVLAPDASTLLNRYSWPGNVRELKAVMERAIVLTRSTSIEAQAVVEAIDLGNGYGPQPGLSSESIIAHEAQRLQLLSAAERCAWNPRRLAAELQVSRATLYRRLRAMGISLSAFSQSHSLTESHQHRETG